MLMIAGSFGGFGLIVALAVLIIYLVSFETFKTPLIAPFSPLITKDLKDTFYKGLLIEQQMRPLSLKNKNKRRMNPKKIIKEEE